MDAPPIQYARTEDGVNIAYAVSGRGVPLIRTPARPFNHLDYEWEIPEFRRWYEALSSEWQFVRYDPRGQGLSQREVTDFSHEANVRDLEAVMAKIDQRPVVLFGQVQDCPTVIDYSLRHPGEVAALILWNPQSGSIDPVDARRIDGFLALAKVDWDFFIDVFAHWVLGWRDDELTGHEKELIRRSITQEQHVAYWEQHASRSAADASLEHLYGQIDVPTLVLYRRNAPSSSVARSIAALIPGVQQIGLEGTANPVWAEDVGAVVQAMRDFLAEHVDLPSASPDGDAPASAFRPILFTDVVASTPLLAQLKDAKMREIMRDHDAVLNAAIAEHGGRVVKEIGDAFMVDFAVPSAAVECAIAIQREIQAQFAGSDVPIRLRIGINAGEPVVEDDDLHGASVVIAKRLESAAPVNGILIADGVKQLLAGKDFAFADQGDVALKGFDDPVRAWTVEWT